MSDLTQVEIEHRDDVVVARLTGELDISTAPRFEEALRRVEGDGPDVVVADLSRLEFMDSTGLRLLVAADGRAREAGRRFVLVRGNDMIHRVLRLTRLDERLEIVEDADAVAAA